VIVRRRRWGEVGNGEHDEMEEHGVVVAVY
jgi:hypothetical protein